MATRTPPPRKELVTIDRCPRCGRTHDDILIVAFTNMALSYTHFAYCPSTREPILVKYIYGTKKAKAKAPRRSRA